MYGDYLDGSGEERNDCGENEGGVIEQYADEQELAALWALACTSSWNAMTPALSPFGDSWIMKDWYAKKIVTFENRNMEE